MAVPLYVQTPTQRAIALVQLQIQNLMWQISRVNKYVIPAPQEAAWLAAALAAAQAELAALTG
jgi:hypothetical protein